MSIFSFGPGRKGIFSPGAVKVEPPQIDPQASGSGITQQQLDVAIFTESQIRQAVEQEHALNLQGLNDNVVMGYEDDDAPFSLKMSAYSKTAGVGGLVNFNPNANGTIFSGVHSMLVMWVSGSNTTAGAYHVTIKTFSTTFIEFTIYEAVGLTPIASAQCKIIVFGK